MLDSKEPQGLLGSALSPNMPLLMAGLGMMGSGYKGALPGLMAGMEAQRKQQGVQDWSALLGGGALGGSGASQTAGTAPAVPSPMLGIGGPSAASPAGGMRAQSGAAPGNYGEVVKRIVGVESGGRANARNPRSSATGLGQFIDSTWLATLKKHRPDLAQGQSDQQLLALRTDPGLSREMTAAYAQDNADALAAQGLPTGPAEIYAAHHLGPAGAAKVLSAAPNTPLSSLLDAGAMQANPHLQGMTAGGFRQWAAGKMRQETAGPVPSPQAQQSFVSGLTPEARQRLARLAANNPTVASAILTAMFKGQESYTLGPGQVRYRGNQVVARGPASAPDLKYQKQGNDIVVLQAGREVNRIRGAANQPPPEGYRWTEDGSLEAIPGGPAIKGPQEQWAPLTPAERAAAGITDADTRSFQRNTVTGQIRPLGSGPAKPQEQWTPLSPQERAAVGIPETDTRPYQRNAATGQIRSVGGAGTNVTVNNKGETEYDKTRGKAFAEEAGRIQKEARQADTRIAQYQRIDSLLSNPNVYTGTGGSAIQALKKAGSTLLGLDFKGVADAEAAQRIASELALQMGQLLEGTLSNSDRAFVEGLPPNIGDSAAGRKAIVQMAIDAEERKKEIAGLAREYIRLNKRLDAGWDATLADWLDENPLFTEERQREIMGMARQTQQPPPSAGITERAYNVKTGEYLVYDPTQNKWVPE